MSIRNRLLLLGMATVIIPVCLTFFAIQMSFTSFARAMQDATNYDMPEYLQSLQATEHAFDFGAIKRHINGMIEAKDDAAVMEQAMQLDAQMLTANIITEITVDGMPYYSSAYMPSREHWVDNGWRLAFVSDITLGDGREARLTLHFGDDLIAFTQGFLRGNSTVIALTLFLSLALTCGVLSYLVSLSITRPIKALAKGLHEVRDGRLDGEPLPVCGHDELSQLTVGFNAMRSRLKSSVSNQVQMESNRKELLVNIAHDLRTPITSIKGYVEGILDGVANDPEKREKYLLTIRRKADEMDHLVDNLFLFSTLDMGRVEFNFEKVSLGPFLGDCAEELSYELSKQDMLITYSDQTPTPPVVMMDRMQFKRVILNIAENSDKYKRGDTGKLDITMTCRDGMAVVSFADDGIGIPADMLDKVFGQFVRGDASRNANIKGNGLGLAIARQIIDAHGGEITAVSPPGQGTVITIKLPMEGSK